VSIYEFAPGAENNSYVFPTNKGWLYTIVFRNSSDYFNSNETLFNSSLVFEIIFTRSIHNTCILNKGFDPMVKDTIHCILQHHLVGNGHLPFYIFICYSADKKEASKMNLFIKWYSTFDSEDWVLHSYELIDGTDSIHYGLIVNNKHPDATIIPTEFEHFVGNEKNVWKDVFRRL